MKGSFLIKKVNACGCVHCVTALARVCVFEENSMYVRYNLNFQSIGDWQSINYFVFYFLV